MEILAAALQAQVPSASYVPPHAPSLELIHRLFKNLLNCLLLFWLKLLCYWLLLFYKQILTYHSTEIRFWLSLVKCITDKHGQLEILLV